MTPTILFHYRQIYTITKRNGSQPSCEKGCSLFKIGQYGKDVNIKGDSQEMATFVTYKFFWLLSL